MPIAGLVDHVRRERGSHGRLIRVAIGHLRARNREAREGCFARVGRVRRRVQLVDVQRAVEAVVRRDVVVDADRRVTRQAVRRLLEAEPLRVSCRRASDRAAVLGRVLDVGQQLADRRIRRRDFTGARGERVEVDRVRAARAVAEDSARASGVRMSSWSSWCAASGSLRSWRRRTACRGRRTRRG